jgi:hypothetical protein
MRSMWSSLGRTRADRFSNPDQQDVDGCGTIAVMPWVPELFSAPALQEILDRRRRDALLAVPYFDGLLAGDPDPLVESFAGTPEMYDPLRGRVKGVAAFRAFVIETHAWLLDLGASVDDVEHVILARHGFEEVVLHLDTRGGTVDVPVVVVADRVDDGRIEEVRVYFDPEPLTGRRTDRPPLLQPDPGLAVPDAVAALYARLPDGSDITLEPCALVDDGRACAFEHNVVRGGTTTASPRAAVAVVVRGDGRTPDDVRAYGGARL